MTQGPTRSHVASHYGREGLAEAIETALRAAGLDPARLSPEDLNPVDQFHIMGHDATHELARRAGITAKDEVLDVGGGIGGPARLLASAFGARVTVLDLTPEFCRAGALMTAWTGLQDRVRFEVGDALDIPAPPLSYDVVWTQHSTMNIPDKPELYRQARRVLRPGGRLAMHEITAGPAGQPVRFPVPWASEPSLSSLLSAGRLRDAILEAGFRPREWTDLTDTALAWVRERLAGPGPGPLGLHLLMGDDTRPALENVRASLEEKRLTVVMGVFTS